MSSRQERPAGHPVTGVRVHAAVLVAAVCWVCGCGPHHGGAEKPPPTVDEMAPAVVLGAPPLCEASAAVIAPWDPDTVLVADNEISDRLFAFAIDARGLLTGQQALWLQGEMHADDLESVAVAGERLLLVGSHGRDSHCRRRPERERLELIAWDRDAGQLHGDRLIDSTARCTAMLASVPACLEVMFTSPAPEHAAPVCEAIVDAAQRVDAEHCIPPLDIEGAASARDPDSGAQRVWVGLRQPRVSGRPALLRLVPALDELRFDAVAVLDVGDRGIRSLAATDRHLGAILGPHEPSWDHSDLWWAQLEKLRPGASIEGELLHGRIPPSSEGLVIVGGQALVVTDGDEGPSEDATCEEPARQLRVDLGLPAG